MSLRGSNVAEKEGDGSRSSSSDTRDQDVGEELLETLAISPKSDQEKCTNIATVKSKSSTSDEESCERNSVKKNKKPLRSESSSSDQSSSSSTSKEENKRSKSSSSERDIFKKPSNITSKLPNMDAENSKRTEDKENEAHDILSRSKSPLAKQKNRKSSKSKSKSAGSDRDIPKETTVEKEINGRLSRSKSPSYNQKKCKKSSKHKSKSTSSDRDSSKENLKEMRNKRFERSKSPKNDRKLRKKASKKKSISLDSDSDSSREIIKGKVNENNSKENKGKVKENNSKEIKEKEKESWLQRSSSSSSGSFEWVKKVKPKPAGKPNDKKIPKQKKKGVRIVRPVLLPSEKESAIKAEKLTALTAGKERKQVECGKEVVEKGEKSKEKVRNEKKGRPLLPEVNIFDSRRVYVTNMPFSSTYLEIKEKFSSVGEVTFIQMLRDKYSNFQGSAVITYKSPEMALKAKRVLNKRTFNGRKLKVKGEDAVPDFKVIDSKYRQNRQPADLSLSLSQPTVFAPGSDNTYGLSMTFLESLQIDLPLVNSVFVANLHLSVDEKMLKEVFNLAGKVVNCEVYRDKEGNSRGYGVVEYDHPVEAVQAISMLHRQVLTDRSLFVRMDRRKNKKESKPRRLPVGLKSVGMGLGFAGNPLKDVRSLQAANPMAAVNLIEQANPMPLRTVNPSPLTQQVSSGVGLLGAGPRIGLLGDSPGSLPRGLLATPGTGLNTVPDYSQNSCYGGGSLGNVIQITNLFRYLGSKMKHQ